METTTTDTTTKKSKSGIVILAGGSPFYGRMALMLAGSIKRVSPKASISLICTDSAKTHILNDIKKVFDKVIHLPQKAYQGKEGTSYFRAKLFMYELSPYDRTIFLDADMVWMIKPAEGLFKELEGVSFTIQNRGKSKDSQWGENEEMLEKFGKDGVHSIHSEFMYWEKSKEVKALFAEAVKFYDRPTVKVKKSIGGVVPDELALTLAMHEKGINPHQDFYTPVFWSWAHGPSVQRKEAQDSFYACSMGGNDSSKMMKDIYHVFALKGSQVNDLTYYKFTEKPKWDRSRTSI